MLTYATLLGQAAALQTLGFHKQANALVEKAGGFGFGRADAVTPPAPVAEVPLPAAVVPLPAAVVNTPTPAPAQGALPHAPASATAATAKAPGYFSKLRNAKVPLKAGLGLGALAGTGMLVHELGKQPEMEVIPSSPVAPLFP